MVRRALKLTIMALAIGMSATGLAACTTGEPAPDPSKSGSFAIVGDMSSVLSWDAIKAGATKASQDLGVSVVFTAADGTTDQAGLIHQTMTSKPTGIGVGVTDDAQTGEAIGALRSSGIPAVLYDSPASDASLVRVVSNDEWIGQTAAQQLVMLVNGGKVVVVGNGSAAGKARAVAFRDYLAKNASRVTVVTVEGSGRAGVEKVVAGVLGKSSVVAVFATDGVSTLGVVDAVKSAGAKKTKIVGVDALPEVVKAVRKGTIAGAIAQNPFNIGYQMVRVLANTVDGTPSPQKTIYSQAVWYTATTINDPTVSTILNGQ